MESHEETIDVKRDKIRKNDVVSVEYTVSCDGSIVNRVDEESFMVGAGKYNMQIENALLGKNKKRQRIKYKCKRKFFRRFVNVLIWR